MQAEQVNRRRHPTLKFKVGDIVMLDTRNIKITCLNKLLDHKNLGPFKIIRVINNLVYKLKLLLSMAGIFSIFYLWLLHLDNSDPLSGQRIDPLFLVIIDKEGKEL